MGPVVDAETGFVYLRARYYDPATGQFLTRDPIEAVTQEPYAYASNDPLNKTDPTGLMGEGQRRRGERNGYPCSDPRATGCSYEGPSGHMFGSVTLCAFGCIEVTADGGLQVRVGFGPAAYAGFGVSPSGPPPKEADQFFGGVSWFTGSVQRPKDPCAPYDQQYGSWEPGYNIGPSIGGGFVHWWTLR